jgi:hypothetical protein
LLTKELVDDDVVGFGPSNPGEVAESGDDEVGEPRPDEHDSHHDHEPLVTTDRPAIGSCRISPAVIVQGVHETNVDQGTRPDHSSGLDEELANGSSKTKAETLGGQSEKSVETPAELASVEVVEPRGGV